VKSLSPKTPKLSEDHIPLGAEMEKETEAMVVGLVRGDLHIPAPSWHEIIHAGDILIVEANPEDLKSLIEVVGLELAECKGDCKALLGSDDIRIIEAIITPDSPMPGKTATSLHLRRNYGVNLLAIARQGHRLKTRLGQTRFFIGDILLLQGSNESLQEAIKALRCLPLAERGLRLDRPRKSFRHRHLCCRNGGGRTQPDACPDRIHCRCGYHGSYQAYFPE
jgi:uncharacterized protein with PhoU and TrkA domain